MEETQRQYSIKETLKRFLSYYKPHRTLFVADMTASVLISLMGMVYPIITQLLLKTYIPEKDLQMILTLGLSVLGIYIVRLFLRYFVQYYGHMIGTGMQAQMRRDLFTHLQKLPFSFYDEHETGKILTRMTSDLFDVAELAHHGPENLLISVTTFIAAVIYLSTISVPLTLIIFVCVPILIVVASYFRAKMRDAFKERRQSTAVINASLESSISGIRVTKAYTNSEKEMEKFEVGNNAFVNACKKAYYAMALYHSSSSFITDIFNVVILIAGGLFLYNGKIDLADYIAFVTSVNLFISPINTLINFMEQFQNGVTGFERFMDIMDYETEKESENAVPFRNPKGNIELQNVTFSYEDGKKVLDNVNLTVNSGKTLALVGPSGGGKTTICHLIPKFYQITEGKILLDGQDISQLTNESVRKSIGIVQQDVFLFNGTIRDNILYGNLDATEEEITQAAKNANLHDWIVTLEKGYDTEIGERGVKLSGGQKQRLSIARVFLKNPPILILDEATSALDNTTEILIQNALNRLSVGRTTIIVAHRLSTIRNADTIAVISGGKIAESGTHEELMQMPNGIYHELYDLQFRANESAERISDLLRFEET